MAPVSFDATKRLTLRHGLDQNTWLLQAVANGSSRRRGNRALFADVFLTDAKLAQDRGQTAGSWLASRAFHGHHGRSRDP